MHEGSAEGKLGVLDQTLGELRKGQKHDVTYILGESLLRFIVFLCLPLFLSSCSHFEQVHAYLVEWVDEYN